MGRMYTIDHKLLTDTPEVRIGDKIFPVDDRQKTVKKIMAVMEQKNKNEFERIDEVMAVALGEKNAKIIDDMNLPFAAQQAVYENVLAAIMGEDPQETADRFQKSEDTDK